MSGERVAQMLYVPRRGRLAKRFGWSSPTAGKFITALLERDLLERVDNRPPKTA